MVRKGMAPDLRSCACPVLIYYEKSGVLSGVDPACCDVRVCRTLHFSSWDPGLLLGRAQVLVILSCGCAHARTPIAPVYYWALTWTYLRLSGASLLMTSGVAPWLLFPPSMVL